MSESAQEVVGQVRWLTEEHVSACGYASGQLAVLVDLVNSGKLTVGDLRDVKESS